MLVLGNINTFQLPPNLTLENHQLPSGGGFGFLFAPLLLFYYFLPLIINRLAQGCPSLGLNDISPCALTQKQALDNFLKFSKSPVVISLYKRKKFLHV